MSLKQRNVLTIFIGSPGDLGKERQETREVVERINNTLGRYVGLFLELRGWEDTLPGYSRPQEKITEDVRSCDLFLGLLWQRWGTPTGEKYTSGFEEEFDIALERKQNEGLIDIWLFFKDISKEFLNDPGEQLKKVLEFKSNIESNRNIFYKTFNSTENWGKQVHDILTEYIIKEFGIQREIPNSSQPVTKRVKENIRQVIPEATSASEEVSTALSNLLSSLAEEEKLTELDGYTRARTYLLSSALLYDSVLTTEVLNTHVIQFLYAYREKLELLPVERRLIFRTLINDLYNVKVGWFWLSNIPFKVDALLIYLALRDSSENTRIQALKYLSLISTTPELEKLKVDFSQKQQKEKLAILRIFENHGTLSDIPFLETIFINDSSDVSVVAWTSIFAILSRNDPQQALEFLYKTPKINRGEYKKYFETLLLMSQDKKVLERLLQDEDNYIRLQIYDSIKDSLDETQLHSLTADGIYDIRAKAYLELLKRNLEVNIDEIRKKPDEGDDTNSDVSSLASILGNNLSKWDYKESVLFEFYKKKSFEELEKSSIDWFSLDREVIYEALAERYFDLFKDTLRKDIFENFERIIKEKIRFLQSLKITDEKEAQSVDKIKEDWLKYDSFIRNRLLLSATRVLAKLAEPVDIKVARFLIHKNLEYYRDDILRNLLTIFFKYGTTNDLEYPKKLVTEEGLDIKTKAAEVALSLDGENKFNTLEFLLEKNETELTNLVFKKCIQESTAISFEQVKKLLLHQNEQIRLSALSYLMLVLREDELITVLNDYLTAEIYYYNVVCWLDRWLYAPNALKEYYQREITQRLS